MSWIDYEKNAYYLVLHSWTLKYLEMVGAADNIVVLIRNIILQWKTVPTSDGIKIADVSIK